MDKKQVRYNDQWIILQIALHSLQIEDLLAPIYGLTPEQHEFVKTFDIEWRTDEE